MHNFIKKMTLLCLRKFNSDATDYVQSTQPTQTIQTNLYTICYRKIRRHISFFITPIILSSLIACGGGGGSSDTTPPQNPGGDGPGGGGGGGGAAPALTSPASTAATPLGFTSLRVTWDSVPQAERYEVYDSNEVKVATIVPPATSYTATGLSPNTEYTYSIKACNESSCSTSAASSAATSGNKNGGDTIINSAAELNAIRADSSTLAGNYILAADIDLSDIPNWRPIGDSANGFTGSFDGSGYEISGMTISGYEYAGLFGYVHGASISNLGVNVNNINSSSTHAYAGGLAAHANSSFISNVYVIVASNITSSAESSSYAGGLFGRVDNSQISNSYVVVRGSISSSFSSGGLVGGSSNSSISNSYYSASRESSEGEFSNSHGTSQTVAQLRALTAESTDWDKDTWYFGTANDLPRLSSEFVPDVEPPPVNVPASPRGVTVAPLNSTYIRVSWNSVPDVEFYKVYNNRGGSVNTTPPATSYTATDLLPNTGYTYRVAACNDSGCSAFTSRSAATLPTPIPVPASPNSISAAGQDFTSVTITWSKVLGTKHYEVYNGAAKVATLGESRTTYIINKDLLPATEYIYSVKACNDSGCSDSTEIDFFTDSIGISSAPQVIVVDSTIGQAAPSLDVSWNYISGVTSYQIFDAAENKVATVQSPTTNRIITDLSAGTLYEYKVRGCYTSSVTAPGAPESTEICGDFSAVGSASTPVAIPATPSNVAAAVQGLTSIIISWDSVVGATSYEVYNGDVLVTTINNPSTTSYTATALLPATEYTYSVKACNTSGCSDSASAATTPTPVAIPAVPSNVAAAVQGLTSIRISWDSVDGATSYEVYNGDVQVATIDDPATSYIATALLPATEYTYSVKACNLSGCSVAASAATTITPVAIPDSSSSISTGSLNLTARSITWRAVSGATSYEVYNGDVQVATIDAPTTRYNATALLPNTEYTYSVKACNISGCSVSTEVTFTTEPIGVSSTLEVTVVTSTIGQANPSLMVSWDGITGVTSYQIFDAAGNADENKVATVPAPKTSHIIADLSAGTLYEYRVRGCYTPSAPASPPGSSEVCGDFSAVDSATTPVAIPAVPSNVAAAVQGLTSIRISWDSVVGATSYEVYNGDELVTTIDASTTSYTATDLLPATEYTYSVKACNTSGCSVVGEITATTKAIGASNAPRITAVASTIGQAAPSLNVSWDHISGVTSYQIFDAAENKVATAPASKTSHIIADLLAGTLYTYKVRGCYTPSAESAEVCGDFSPAGSTTAPVVIPNSPSSISAGSLSLTARSIIWGAVSGATSYEVYKGDEKVATINAPTTSYTATALLPNTGYTYSVKACNPSGCSDSTEVIFTTDPIDVSDAPEVSVVTSTIGQANPSLNVSWDYIRGVTSYQIFDADENNIVNISAPTRSHIIANLSAGTLYEYKVRGCYTPSAPGSTEICGDFSPAGSATTPVAIPDVPGNVAATSLGFTSIRISWDSVEGTAFYEVNNSDGLVIVINHPTTSYTATDLLPNTEYTYGVKACNPSVCSSTASATTITNGNKAGGTTSISSAAELAAIRANSVTLDGDYALTGNINLSDIPNWQPIGNNTNKFTGSFDGNGYNISGVSSSGYQHAGLFGYVQNANISNVGVLVGSISSSSSSSYSGGLIGYALSSPISNSYAVVGGNISSSYSGGLVGFVQNSPISNSYAVVGGRISSPSSRAGGLVGLAFISPISNSYAVVGGSISAYSYASAGGLVGEAVISPISNSYAVVGGSISSTTSGGLVGVAVDNPISNSYAVVGGSISSTSPGRVTSAGGLAGVALSSPITNSYYNASRKPSEGGFSNTNGTSQTLAQLRRLTADATTWDGVVWDFGTDANLPTLRSLPSPVATRSPVIPEDVSATLLGLTSIRISWGSVDKATSYEVYNSSGLVSTIEFPTTNYGAIGLLPNTQYTYRVRACNLFGCSAFAGGVSATTETIGKTSAPQVTLVASTIGRAITSLKVSWDSIKGVTSYQIFDANGNNKVATVPDPSTEYVVAGLAADTLYEYQVRGCYDSGVSASPPESSEVCGELSPVGSATTSRFIPSAPSGVTATVLGITSLSISWNSVEGALTYQVHNSGGLVATIDAPTTSYTTRGLLPNTGYTYSVKACYNSDCSDSVSTSATTENGITISSAVELAAIRANSNTLAGDYALTGNIDLSHIPNWQPIGNEANKFAGSFDGNGYNISGVSSSGYQYAALFGYVANADINNVGVLVVDISSTSPSSYSDSYSGGLVGRADNSQISNSYVVVKGSISSSLASSSSYNPYLGGLVGLADNSQISNSYAVVEGSISLSPASFNTYLGGLVGYAYNNSPIRNSYALVEGSISSDYSGGLVGYAEDSPISNSYAVVEGSISALFYSGGLVGYAEDSPISNSYAVVVGSISSSSEAYSGGLVGYAYNSQISNSYAVVGGNISSSSYSSGSNSGGLVGYASSSPISNSYAVVGGSISSSLSDSYSSYSSDSNSGGLVGSASSSPISNSYAVVGGSISSSLSDSYSSYSSYSNSGGLVGRAAYNSQISNSYYSASRKSSEGEFSNTHGTSQTLAELRALTASATGWDAGIWDFGTAANLPTLRSLPSPAPAIPGDVSATALGLTSISISWGSVDKATSYQVHNSGALVSTIEDPATSYAATDLLPDTQYTYRVRACNFFGCSDFASDVSATTMIFRISSAAELAAIRTDSASLARHYDLTGNIDLSDIPNWQPIGNATNKFTGSFDGNGYKISGVSSTGYQFAGLFGYVENADISNVGVLVGNISSSSFSSPYTGGLVGYARLSEISNSYAVVEGSISSSSLSRSSYSGGLVGNAYKSRISNSYAVVGGNISSSSRDISFSGGLVGRARSSKISNSYALVEGSISSSSYSDSYSGGLVGVANESPISNSYALVEGSISSSSSRDISFSGGLVGAAFNNSPISNSYAVVVGSISSSTSSSNPNSYAGGLVGYADDNSPISTSYYSASRKSSEGGFTNTLGTSQTVAQLRALTASVTTWDANIWDFGTDANLPILRSLPSPVAARSPTSPGDVTATALSLSSISMSWGNVVGATSYEVYNSEGLVGSTSHPTTSYAATGLLPDTQYTYRVRACNVFGCSDFASDVSATTDATVGTSSAPQVTLVASTIGRAITSLKVSWDSIAGVTSYQILNRAGEEVATVLAPSTEYVVASLAAGTLYEYQVRGCYDSGVSASPAGSSEICGELSEVGSATTSRFIPAPSGVTATVLGITSLSISWNSVEGAVTYQVHNSDGLVATIEAPTTSYTTRDLLPNTEYTYSVKACNDTGCSASVSASATTENGITISSAAELATIRTNSKTLAGNYALTGNIDLSHIPNWQPIGDSTNVFTGSFDGNGYNISGVSSSGYQHAGLFGYVGNADISNVGVLVGNISSFFSSSSSSSSGRFNSYSGGLVGFAFESPISNSYAVVEGSISSSSSSSSGSYSGGLVGYASYSPISNSYAFVEGSISSSSSSSGSNSGGLVGSALYSVISNSYALVADSISSSGEISSSGGLVGSAFYSVISNSYALVGGNISSISSSGSSYSGGLVGWAYDRHVSNSYAVVGGNISSTSYSGSSNSGGLVGLASRSISKSYYSASRKSSEGAFSNTHGTSQTPVRLRALTADATGWDEVIWDFGTNNDLPTLRSLPSSDITAILSPASPEDFTATALGLTSLSMSWDSVDKATSYEVYNGSGLVTTIEAPATNYVATGLLPEMEYTYRVRACNLFGCSAFASASAMTMVASISSAADLAAIRSNSNTLDGDYALTGNIDLSHIPNWQPIGGSYANAFTGSFDGNGYNISGVSSSDYQSAGLFGYAVGASISNVGVLVSYISSSTRDDSYSGGLVSYAADSQISNSYAVVEGSISSSAARFNSYSGGLVGFASNSQISNSYAVVGGNISSSSANYDTYSGGLVGRAVSSEISNSYAVVGGSISSSSPSYSRFYIGGLVGGADDDSPISNSYYSTSRQSSEGEFTNTNGTSQTLAELRRLTADATGWDEGIWDFGTNNDLPTLRSSHSAGIVSPLPLLPDPDSNNGVGKETNRDTDGDGTPDHVDTDDDDDNYSDALDVDDDGDGLIEIATAEQLNQVRHNLLGSSLKTSAGDAGADTGCGGLNGISECNGYELVADISLAGYNSNNWLPIGSCPTFTEANVCTDVSALFNAVFDGNGYTISNLTITNSIESYTNATGLFGAISPASQLRNIHVRSANLIGGANNVGVLVGYAARASIIDSSAVGEITAYGTNVGGLVGFGRNTTIISSYAAGGNIVGVSGVGGLIGSGERATISSSYAAGGDVSGVVYIGGLVGSGNSVTISLSYAAGGHVVAGFAGGGGLVGSGENARVISSYAAGGNVSGAFSIGGLIGSGENATIISSYAAGDAVLTAFGVGDGLVGSEGVTATDSYWDSDTTGVAAGIYGLPQTTRELQTPTSTTGIYTNWATDECDDGGDAWDFGTASQYPVLTCTPDGVDAQRP